MATAKSMLSLFDGDERDYLTDLQDTVKAVDVIADFITALIYYNKFIIDNIYSNKSHVFENNTEIANHIKNLYDSTGIYENHVINNMLLPVQASESKDSMRYYITEYMKFGDSVLQKNGNCTEKIIQLIQNMNDVFEHNSTENNRIYYEYITSFYPKQQMSDFFFNIFENNDNHTVTYNVAKNMADLDSAKASAILKSKSSKYDGKTEYRTITETRAANGLSRIKNEDIMEIWNREFSAMLENSAEGVDI